MRHRQIVVVATSFLLFGCSSPAPAPSAAPAQTSPPVAAAAAPKTYDEKVPPTKKQIVEALLASRTVPLSVDSSCSGVGTDPSDSTIGEYLSGFLAEQTPDGKNWLDISAQPAPAQDGGPAWKCDVVVRHVNGDDRWGWGVSFLMDAKNHVPFEKSYRCTGGG